MLSNEKKDMLNKEYCEEEVAQAIKATGPLKAPGPDGFHAVFYQICREIVGGGCE